MREGKRTIKKIAIMKQKKGQENTDNEQIITEPNEAENPAAETAADNLADESSETADKEADLTEEVAAWQDKYLRLSAEFDNFRKRTLREKMELTQSGRDEIIRGILPVVDDIDRAMDAMEKTDDIAAVREGVKLINQKFLDFLRQKGVTEIEALGLPLDTDYHDAVAKFPVEDPEKRGRIIDVVQKGYKHDDKVIRFAKVVVGE